MTRMIALLRAVNVGNRRLPMSELREIAAELGFADAKTYVASGNLVFTAGEQDPEAAGKQLEAAIARRYGWKTAAILRTARQWTGYAAGSAFPEAEQDRPRMLHLLLSKQPPARDAAARLTERAQAGERIAIKGGALWIDFANGVARSKLTPVLIDTCVGSPSTARNWKTVLQLQEMSAA